MRGGSGLLDVHGLEHDGLTIDLAVDLMVAVDEADVAGLGADLQILATLELQLLDEGDAVAVDEDVAVGILHHSSAVAAIIGVGSVAFAGPLVAADGALKVLGGGEDVGHGADRAGVGHGGH